MEANGNRRGVIRFELDGKRAFVTFLLLAISWGVFFGLGERTGRKLARVPLGAEPSRDATGSAAIKVGAPSPTAPSAPPATTPAAVSVASGAKLPPEEQAQFRMAEDLKKETFGKTQEPPVGPAQPAPGLTVPRATAGPAAATPGTSPPKVAATLPASSSTPRATPASGTLSPSIAFVPTPAPKGTSAASTAPPIDLLTRPAPKTKSPAGPLTYTVQVASVKSRADAEAILKQLAARGYRPFVQEYAGKGPRKWYRVRVGHFATKEEAESLAYTLVSLERLKDSRVMREQ